MPNTTFGDRVNELRDYFAENMDKLESMAAPGVDVENYIDRLFQEATKTPKLASCTTGSLWQCLSDSVVLGLPIGATHGYAYAIPREDRDKGVVVANFQTGYQGRLKLVLDSPKVIGAKAEIVYSSDEFDYEDGSHPRLSHKPALRARGEPIGYWAAVWLVGDKALLGYMDRMQVETHRNTYAKGWQRRGSAWQSSFDGMALKTVLGRPLKFAPGLAEEARRVINTEDAFEARDAFQPGDTAPTDDMDALADELDSRGSAPGELFDKAEPHAAAEV